MQTIEGKLNSATNFSVKLGRVGFTEKNDLSY